METKNLLTPSAGKFQFDVFTLFPVDVEVRGRSKGLRHNPKRIFLDNGFAPAATALAFN